MVRFLLIVIGAFVLYLYEYIYSIDCLPVYVNRVSTEKIILRENLTKVTTETNSARHGAST